VQPRAATCAGQLQGRGPAIRWRFWRKKMREAHAEPRPGKVLCQDPTGWDLWRTMVYLFSLPTHTLLIVVSILVYFFFHGAEAFAIIYFAPHYRLPTSVVSAFVIVIGVSALAGLLTGGNLSRRLLHQGKINARIIVPACALFLSAPFFAAGIWLSNLWIAVPLLVVAAALTAALAPIDAARLDIIHPRLWGRGEGGRMALRGLLQAGAPLLFGAISGLARRRHSRIDVDLSDHAEPDADRRHSGTARAAYLSARRRNRGRFSRNDYSRQRRRFARRLD
jgi:hypothetical protein